MTEEHREEHTEDDAPLSSIQAEAAAAYHAPSGSIPRDAMWAAIQASRSRADIVGVSTPSAGSDAPPLTVVRITRGAMTRHMPRWIAGAAAAAILAAVGVTGYYHDDASHFADTADSTMTAGAWQVASAEHFGLAESMLTTLAASRRSDGAAELSAWSRDLLESTRLLMDSPAGRDPKRRALLEDLELVLVQLVESGPAMRREDRSVVDEMLSRSALLLTRIRTNIPAGVPASHN